MWVLEKKPKHHVIGKDRVQKWVTGISAVIGYPVRFGFWYHLKDQRLVFTLLLSIIFNLHFHLSTSNGMSTYTCVLILLMNVANFVYFGVGSRSGSRRGFPHWWSYKVSICSNSGYTKPNNLDSQEVGTLCKTKSV